VRFSNLLTAPESLPLNPALPGFLCLLLGIDVQHSNPAKIYGLDFNDPFAFKTRIF